MRAQAAYIYIRWASAGCRWCNSVASGSLSALIRLSLSVHLHACSCRPSLNPTC